MKNICPLPESKTYHLVILFGHRFQKPPQSEAIWNVWTRVVLLRRQMETIKGSWKVETQRSMRRIKVWAYLLWKLVSRSPPLISRGQSLDQSPDEIYKLSTSAFFSALYSFWNLEMPTEEHARSLYFLYIKYLCLLLNWSRMPSCCLKSINGNVNYGNNNVFSQDLDLCTCIPWITFINSLEVKVIQMTTLATWMRWLPRF